MQYYKLFLLKSTTRLTKWNQNSMVSLFYQLSKLVAKVHREKRKDNRSQLAASWIYSAQWASLLMTSTGAWCTWWVLQDSQLCSCSGWRHLSPFPSFSSSFCLFLSNRHKDFRGALLSALKVKQKKWKKKSSKPVMLHFEVIMFWLCHLDGQLDPADPLNLGREGMSIVGRSGLFTLGVQVNQRVCLVAGNDTLASESLRFAHSFALLVPLPSSLWDGLERLSQWASECC